MKMKRWFLVVIAFVGVIFLTGCENGLIRNNQEDARKFKEEYEKLNGTSNSSGQEHRTITINENNPFVYATTEEIVEKINNNETFYVYFGSAYCPWCRSVMEKAIEQANEKKIETIYYVDIWGGDDHTEVVRDVYELDEDGKPVEVSKGIGAYHRILEKASEFLSDYQLTDADGNKVSVGEKRIGAPTFMYVKEGKVVKAETGISKNQKGSRVELTEEILNDEQELFKQLFSE